jgi:hypothetical protein
MLIFIVNLEEMQSAALLLGGSGISFKIGTWYHNETSKKMVSYIFM